MATLGQTIWPPTARFTERDAVATVVWAVRSTADTGTQERVLWSIQRVGELAPMQVGEATQKGIYQPTFSDVQSRMPNSRPGKAPIFGYSKSWTMSDLDPGTYVVSAVAVGKDGTIHNLRQVAFQNDSEIDSRSCRFEVWVNGESGNDSNSGAQQSQLKTIHAGILRLKALCGSNNIGGGVLRLRGNFIGGGGPTNPGSWETGPLEFLTLDGSAGATFERVEPPGTTYNGNPNDLIRVIGNGFQTWTRVLWRQCTFVGGGPILYNTSVNDDLRIDQWRDGCEWVSRFWDGNGSRARFTEDSPDATKIETSTGAHVGWTYVTGERHRGGTFGYRAYDLLYDCAVESCLGGGIYCSGRPQDGATFHSVVIYNRTYERNVTRGWGTNYVLFQTPQLLTGEDRGGGVYRIRGPVGGLPFGESLADNIGSTRTLLDVRGWGGEVPNGQYTILDGGTEADTRPYVDIAFNGDNSNAAAGCQIETWVGGSQGGLFGAIVHPSSCSVDDGAARTNTIMRDIAHYDMANEVQSHFSNAEGPITRLWMENTRDGGVGANWNMGGVSYVDSVMANITAATSNMVITGSPTYSLLMEHCVFLNSNGIANAITNGLVVRGCHFVQGSAPAGATDTTTGAWFDAGNDPTEDPWSQEPAESNKGTGLTSVQDPEAWAFDTDQSTKGALKNVALLHWDYEPNEGMEMGGPIPSMGFAAPVSGNFLTGVLMEGSIPTLTFGSPLVGTLQPAPLMPGSIPDMTFGDAPEGSMTTSVEMFGSIPSAVSMSAPNGTITVEALPAVFPEPLLNRVSGSLGDGQQSRDPGPNVPIQFVIQPPKAYRTWGRSADAPPTTDKWTML